MKKLLLVCLMLSFGSASAALNRWVDADGRVHYSDNEPPPNVASKTLRSTTSSDDTSINEAEENPGYALQSVAERQAERKKAKLKKQQADDNAAKEQANAKRLKNYCKSARDNLSALKNGLRLTEVDANGERAFIDDKTRKNNIAKIQQNLKKNCN